MMSYMVKDSNSLRCLPFMILLTLRCFSFWITVCRRCIDMCANCATSRLLDGTMDVMCNICYICFCFFVIDISTLSAHGLRYFKRFCQKNNMTRDKQIQIVMMREQKHVA